MLFVPMVFMQVDKARLPRCDIECAASLSLPGAHAIAVGGCRYSRLTELLSESSLSPRTCYELQEVFNNLRWIIRVGNSVADDAQQLAAVGHRLPTSAAVSEGGRVRN